MSCDLINTISFHNIEDVKIYSVSAKRDYGRRFCVQWEGETQEVIFHDVYKKAKKII